MIVNGDTGLRAWRKPQASRSDDFSSTTQELLAELTFDEKARIVAEYKAWDGQGPISMFALEHGVFVRTVYGVLKAFGEPTKRVLAAAEEWRSTQLGMAVFEELQALSGFQVLLRENDQLRRENAELREWLSRYQRDLDDETELKTRLGRRVLAEEETFKSGHRV